MKSVITIDAALRDPQLLGVGLGDPASWKVWLVTLRAAFGLRLTAAQQRIFHAGAGNRAPPQKRVRELWCIVGRRGGKSRVAAALAVYFACFVPRKLAAGERPMVLVLSASMESAKTVFNYVLGFLQASDVLRRDAPRPARAP